MANFGEMEIKLTKESISAMNEFSAALNHFSDEMSKTVVVFQELKSAQQSVQRTGATFCDCKPPLGDVNPDNRCGVCYRTRR